MLRFFKKLFRHGLGGAVGALLAAGIGAFYFVFPFGTGLVQLSYDLPYASYAIRPHYPKNDVVMVYMDEESHAQLHQPFNASWDRSIHAQLIERLKAEGAKVAVFDVVFSDVNSNAPAGDARFARAIKDFGKVILAADSVPFAYAEAGVTVKNSTQFIPPIDSFMDGAAAIGTADLLPDADLIIRQHRPYSPERLVAPMSWAAADFLGASICKRTNDWSSERWVNYCGPPGFLTNYSYWKALSTNEVPTGSFRDKIVFIGSRTFTKFSGERKDEYRSPYTLWLQTGSNLFMPGVEIHATLLVNLLEENWLTRLPFIEEFNFILLGGLLFGVGLAQLRPFYATTLAFVGAVIVVALAYFMLTQTQHWFAWMIVLVEIAVALVWSIVYNSVNLYVQQKLLNQSLGMYVSPKQVKQIMKQADILKPGAVKQELSILFSDIANFTTMSEGMDSDDLARLMNNYFETAVNKCIHKTDGTVIKYIGDAIFAIWNAPEKQLNHQALACEGALLLRDQVTDFKGTKEGLDVRTRIGLHTGVANVGNFGSSARIDYTALGENINLASRMEGLNKYMGTDVLITGEVEQAVRGKFITRFLGRFQLKGFGKTFEVHELISLPEKAEASRPWREAFDKALEQYERKDFDAAEAGFQGVLKLHPKDGPSKFYLKLIEEHRAEPPGPEWTGDVEMKDK